MLIKRKDQKQVKPYEKRIADAEKNNKIKTLIGFDHDACCSINLLLSKKIEK